MLPCAGFGYASFGREGFVWGMFLLSAAVLVSSGGNALAVSVVGLVFISLGGLVVLSHEYARGLSYVYACDITLLFHFV